MPKNWKVVVPPEWVECLVELQWVLLPELRLLAFLVPQQEQPQPLSVPRSGPLWTRWTLCTINAKMRRIGTRNQRDLVFCRVFKSKQLQQEIEVIMRKQNDCKSGFKKTLMYLKGSGAREAQVQVSG